MAKATKDRVKEWREKKAKKGGRSLSVWLEPDSAHMLHELLAHYGETASPLIARAISTLYEVTHSSPATAEPAPEPEQPTVESAAALASPQETAMEPEAVEPEAVPVPAAAAAEASPPPAEPPPPMLREEAEQDTEVLPDTEILLVDGEADKQAADTLELEEEAPPPPVPVAPEEEQVPPPEEEDLLLKEIQEQLARGVPFRKLHRSLLVDWLKAMQAEGASFQTMADKLNAAGIPTLAGSGRWEPGMIPTVLLLSVGTG